MLPEITEFKYFLPGCSPLVCSGQIFQQAGNNLELVDEQGWSEALKEHLMLPGIESQAIIKQHENCFYLNAFLRRDVCHQLQCNLLSEYRTKTSLVSSEGHLNMDVFKEKKMINPKPAG